MILFGGELVVVLMSDDGGWMVEESRHGAMMQVWIRRVTPAAVALGSAA